MYKLHYDNFLINEHDDDDNVLRHNTKRRHKLPSFTALTLLNPGFEMILSVCLFVCLSVCSFVCRRGLCRVCRVAQIKIPHWTKGNFSTTVRDFYTQIS